MTDTTRHFLLIDDDPVFQAVAEAVLLAMEPCVVTCAGDGEEGLAALADGSAVDAIILDLNMPNVDGLAFLRAAAARGFDGDVVISSGESDAVIDAARHLAKMLGVRVLGALSKPVTPDAVRALLGRTAAATPAGGVKPQEEPLSLDGSTVVPYYQPKVELATGAVVGFEALLRMETHDGQLHGPGYLFDRIVGRDAMVRVTFDIAAQVLSDMRRWIGLGLAPRVAINIDTGMIEWTEFAARMKSLCVEFGVSPKLITLELTERTLPTDLSLIVETLARLRMAGFALSIDDYGTGGANFELFRVCPFSEMKIDQEIVRSAPDDMLSYRFIEFCVGAASERNVQIIAEGIETEEQRALMLRLGVTQGQGFLFARPLPGAAAETALRASRVASDRPREVVG